MQVYLQTELGKNEGPDDHIKNDIDDVFEGPINLTRVVNGGSQ